MSFDKAIEHGKEHRKPYRKPGTQADRSCRPGGGCPYCKGNRMHGDERRKLSAREQMKEAVQLMVERDYGFKSRKDIPGKDWTDPTDLRRIKDGEDLSVPPHKRYHDTHPKALGRRTDRVRKLQQIIDDIHRIADGLASDGYDQPYSQPFHVQANELADLLRKI